MSKTGSKTVKIVGIIICIILIPVVIGLYSFVISKSFSFGFFSPWKCEQASKSQNVGTKN